MNARISALEQQVEQLRRDFDELKDLILSSFPSSPEQVPYRESVRTKTGRKVATRAPTVLTMQKYPNVHFVFFSNEELLRPMVEQFLDLLNCRDFGTEPVYVIVFFASGARLDTEISDEQLMRLRRGDRGRFVSLVFSAVPEHVFSPYDDKYFSNVSIPLRGDFKTIRQDGRPLDRELQQFCRAVK